MRRKTREKENDRKAVTAATPFVKERRASEQLEPALGYQRVKFFSGPPFIKKKKGKKKERGACACRVSCAHPFIESRTARVRTGAPFPPIHKKAIFPGSGCYIAAEAARSLTARSWRCGAQAAVPVSPAGICQDS